MSTAQLSPGSVLDDQYTLGESVRARLGARTHQATTADGTPVHITVYDAECFASALNLERTLRELRQLQGVGADSMVGVLGCGKLDDGRVYEVHQPVVATTLGERLQRGPIELAEASTILGQIGEALLAAQQAGVIHRNLGPNVVFLDAAGAKVAGFAVGEPHGDNCYGPLDTIAPEQIEGKVVDQRTLVYNLAALMYAMMAGKPLFEGAPQDKLAQHASAEPPGDVHEALQRALSKDPRMRPMMLRQFLAELTALGGAEAPSTPQRAQQPQPASGAAGASAAKPTTRGWTMFMNADDTGVEPAPAAPEPVVSGEPSVPAANSSTTSGDAAAAKPTTRGWTMFMTEEETGASDEAGPPPPVAQPPAPVAPAASESGTAPVKPSTRGWTMFMTAEESGAEETPAPAASVHPIAPVPTRSDAAPAKSAPSGTPAPAKPQQPVAPAAVRADEKPDASPSAGAKPSTRGWTMFVDDPKPAAPPAGTASAASPESKAAATPAASAKAKPAVSPASPSARGGGMRTPTGDARKPIPGPAPTRATASAGPPGPSTRGWTMFMEPGKGKGAAASSGPAPSTGAAAPAGGGVRPAAASGKSASSRSGAAPEGENKPSTRGWTMFMDAPLPGKGGAGVPAGGQAGQAIPPGSPPSAAAPRGRTAFAEGQAPGPVSPATAAGPKPGAPSHARTVIAGSGAPPSGPAVTAPGRSAGNGEEMPDTMYFKRGATEPQRDEPSARRPTIEEVEVPTTPVVERDRPSQHAGVPARVPTEHSEPLVPGRRAPIASTGSSTLAWVAVAVAVVGAAVGAFFAFGG